MKGVKSGVKYYRVEDIWNIPCEVIGKASIRIVLWP